MNLLALWPVVQWILRAMGLTSPEDKQKEEEFRLKFLEAVARRDEALIKSFADFQALWHPAAERVYVWVNSVLALYQPTILAMVYYDFFWGTQRAIDAANKLSATLGGLFIMALMLFPFFGPALVPGVAAAFQAAVEAVTKRNGQRNGQKPTSTGSSSPGWRPFNPGGSSTSGITWRTGPNPGQEIPVPPEGDLGGTDGR